MSTDGSLLVALGAGVLSFLSPCVLPLVLPYLCFLAGVESLQRRDTQVLAPPVLRLLLPAVFFVLGFSTVFIALGATASSLGQIVTAHFSTLSIIAGAVILMMGLHLLGLFRVGFLLREARLHATATPSSLAGSYVIGLAFAFGWTPCVGPVLATILLVAGTENTAGRGATLLAAYSAGIGIPFLLAALFVGPFVGMLARYRRHLANVEKVTGLALGITGVLIMTGAMPRVAGWLLQALPTLGTIG